MKKFFIYGVLFIIFSLFLTFIIELSLHLFIKTIKTGDFGVLNKIYKGKLNSDIIISGSSRAYSHFDPSIITSLTGKTCYNIASDGTGFLFQYGKLKFFLEKNKKPEYIIQEVSYSSLDNKDDYIYEPYKYLPYLNNNTLFKIILGIDNNFWIHKYFPPSNLMYYNIYFQKNLAKHLYFQYIKKEDYLINGYYPKDIKWSKEAENFLENKSLGNIYNFNQKCIGSLIDIILLCREKNIKLIFVMPPEYSEVYKFYVNKNEIENIYKNIFNNYDTVFLDYSIIELNKDKKNFYNNKHMNRRGSSLFSTQLAEDLNKILEK